MQERPGDRALPRAQLAVKEYGFARGDHLRQGTAQRDGVGFGGQESGIRQRGERKHSGTRTSDIESPPETSLPTCVVP